MSLLRRNQLRANPFKQFSAWFQEATMCNKIIYPEAMCLSTIGEDGAPDARMVLLKDHSDAGFAFFTNLESTKGRSLRKNPQASLTFYWEPLSRQIRIKGETYQVGDQEADDYFKTRPRLSQIGTWASLQSQVLINRKVLQNRSIQFEKQFAGQEVPRPPHWTGFRLAPSRFEFWQQRNYRMHDRFEYSLEPDGTWEISRLYP